MILERKLNSIDENIEFTMEKASEGNLLFLNCIKNLNEKREILTKLHKNITHIDQYTYFSSNQLLHVNYQQLKL